MSEDFRIVTVNSSNVDQEGFFCYKSKKKSEGYQNKLNWLKARLDEGMVIKILYEGARSVAFIEYMPGETAWRVVEAPDHLVIHCLWVVGKGSWSNRSVPARRRPFPTTGRHGPAPLGLA